MKKLNKSQIFLAELRAVPQLRRWVSAAGRDTHTHRHDVLKISWNQQIDHVVHQINFDAEILSIR